MTHSLCPLHPRLSHFPANFLLFSFWQVFSLSVSGDSSRHDPGSLPEAFCVWVPPPPHPPPSSAPFITLEPEPGDCKKRRGPKATSAGSRRGPPPCHSALPLPVHAPEWPTRRSPGSRCRSAPSPHANAIWRDPGGRRAVWAERPGRR